MAYPPTSDVDYYMFPIRPNQPNSLAGNMGELRSTHFHAGLDIRTGGQTGLPVYAAADGYISRVAVARGGYGKALYIAHPNGETTVYAHLQKFNGEIARYIRDEQYKEEQLHVKLFPEKNNYLVNRGDIIAYSGNSGSSGGPHLHFEIRDKDQNILNPLTYGFEEIKDTTPPVLQKLAVLPQNINARVSGEFSRKEYVIKKVSGNEYQIEDTVRVFGEIGFEVLSHDKLDANQFKCGVSEINFSIESESVFSQRIDKLSFSSQRNILVHYNYPVKVRSGEAFHKLYRADGNRLDLYSTNNRNGNMIFEENCVVTGRIEIKDVYGNISTLSFPIKCENKLSSYSPNPSTSIEVLGNVLKINQSSDGPHEAILLQTKQGEQTLSQAYSSENVSTYLWDMSNGLPSQIDLCDSMIFTDFKEIIPSNQSYTYFEEGMQIEFFKRTLFDTLHFSASARYDSALKSTIYSIGKPALYPVRSNFKVTLAQPNIGKLENRHVYQTDGLGSHSFIGGTWNNSNVEFFTRSFGKYVVLADTIPPTVLPASLNAKLLKFVIDDDLSGIKDFKVLVNGEWLLMDYDYKTKAIWSTDEVNNPDSELVAEVTVVDKAGNVHIEKFNLTQ